MRYNLAEGKLPEGNDQQNAKSCNGASVIYLRLHTTLQSQSIATNVILDTLCYISTRDVALQGTGN